MNNKNLILEKIKKNNINLKNLTYYHIVNNMKEITDNILYNKYTIHEYSEYKKTLNSNTENL